MPLAARRSTVSPARACAYTVIRRVFEGGAYADRALAAEAAQLQPPERPLAMALSYGTVQRAATLDYAASALAGRPVGELEPAVLAALRLGLQQILFLDGVADHAAVNESVELVKRSSPGGATLVNAVLRRAAREGTQLLEELHDRTPEGAAILHSVPLWLAQQWWQELGSDLARGLLRHVNLPAESALRVNTLRSSTERMLAELPVAAHPAPDVPEGVVLDGPFDVRGSELWRRGEIMAQSRASMLVGHLVDPPVGAQVLDLCAAPGAKTTHLAALMGDRGTMRAVERHRARARSLEQTCQRMGARCVQVELGDAATPRDHALFERVLVDPPCSGLGTLQSRPDVRWRASQASISELATLQLRILTAAAAAARPGATIVYSVCTISRAEGQGVVSGFLRNHPEFVLEDIGSRYPEMADADQPRWLQLLPHRHQTDGFFIARLRRR